jgi:hypothetical protein
MSKQNPKRKKRKPGVSRRDFIKQSATAGAAAIAGAAALDAVEAQQLSLRANAPFANPGPARRTQGVRVIARVNRHAVLFAIGDTLIPSAPGDPGYRGLEWYGITDEVNRRLELPDEELGLFNQSSAGVLGKRFTELSETQRADYFNRILQEGGFKDEALQKRLKETYDHVRELVFLVYYQNFPEHSWPRDANRVPLVRPGDEHQITNPNTAQIFTGWDAAGYAGPLTWEEEERRRSYFKKINWQE